MAQGLHLSQRLTQSLVLAPQLQQSLALLQAPTLELKALVEAELQQNPVLEEIDADGDTDLTDREVESGSASETGDPAEPSEAGEGGESVDDFQAEFDRLVQLDQDWRDHFAQTNVPTRASAEDEEKRQFMFDSLVAATTLAESLLEQVRDTNLTPADLQVAEAIIGNIDDYGYLKASIEEVAAIANVAGEKILEVLKVIQTFEPAGVGARDLRECLLLQLEHAQQQDSLEYRIIRDHMDALGKRRVPEIARGTGATLEEVQEAMASIAQLEPRPGRAFLAQADHFVLPEVFVKRSGGDFTVTTNNEHIPHLRISNVYKDLMSQSANSAEVKNYIREKIRAGKFLIKSLHQRQSTIGNIAREIVKRQREFMEKGVAFLKPLTMVQVAEVVGVHETTVSRAVSGKYMETPQGVFEMKYFFTAGLQTDSGANVSNTSVKDMIAEIFKSEDAGKPLSDQEVVKLLKDKGIVIARRTVAKYRMELNILPSNLRKVY
ncbi:MAG TPA: RNA polymerase factor sigma-54 [Verrucomicrobiota bacterium]|nr:RNA polymerase factor sigma-54 [Verrucomicrobiota bacterium]HNT14661.1 RNA polymerase factor sigma-54 [Verrucomicrobiota bacterium]